MPPKKLPIYCLVHRDPETSIFGIKYDKNTTVDEFKDFILTRKKNAFGGYDSPDLTLYKVDIDITTQNPQRAALGNQDVDVVNDLGGQVLNPMDTIEEKFPAPVNKHIYVIVSVSDVAAGRNNNEIITRLDKIDKNIEDMKREKSSVHISRVTEGYWAKIQESTGLDYQATKPETEFPNLGSNFNNEDVVAYRWLDATERAQNGSYKDYLTNILNLDLYQGLGLHDPTGDESFLTTNTDILPVRLSGTTDLVIVDDHSIASQAQEKHIRILFELKKAVNKKHTFQTMAELISADLKSIYPVLAVLTDLIDDWRFFWIKGKVIMRFNLPRADSVALIQYNLKLADDELKLVPSRRTPATQEITEMDTAELASQSSSGLTHVTRESAEMDIEGEPLPKRQKLRHVITTSNVSSDVAPMEDFFDIMSEEEIFKYKAKQILNQFFSQPAFDELDDQKKLPLQSDNETNILD